MSVRDKDCLIDKRKLLITSSVIATAPFWSKPVITAVVLPTHAQTTNVSTSSSGSTRGSSGGGDSSLSTTPRPPVGDSSGTSTTTTLAPGQCSSDWDKSSYVFQGGHTDCTNKRVLITNGNGAETATCPVLYEVFYAATGPAQRGTIVASGQIPALGSPGSSGWIDFSAAVTANGRGNYKVKAYQHPLHPGTGTLWADTCSY